MPEHGTRRLTATMAAAAVLALLPAAVAQAAPTCTADAAKRIITVRSADSDVRVDVFSDNVTAGVRNGAGFEDSTKVSCDQPGLEAVRVVSTDTSAIELVTYTSDAAGSPEPDGTREIEISVEQAGSVGMTFVGPEPSRSIVVGQGPELPGDRRAAADPASLQVNLDARGTDQDADVVIGSCTCTGVFLQLGQAGPGNPDTVVSLGGGRGTGGPVTVPTTLLTYDGDDDLTAGDGPVSISAGDGDDRVHTSNLVADRVACGAGTDTGDVEPHDELTDCEVTAPVATLGDARGVEGGTAEVPITLTPAPGRDVPVRLSFRSGTATIGQDLAGTPVTATVAAGTGRGTFVVPLGDDDLGEDDEQATAVLDAVPAAFTIGDGEAALTIADDEAVASVPDVRTTEGTEAPVRLALDAPAPRAGSITLSGEGVRAQRVTVPAGATEVPVRVPTTDDAADGADRVVTLTLSSPSSGLVAGAGGTLTIADDDPTPAVSAGDASGQAGGTAQVPLRLSGASSTTQSLVLQVAGTRTRVEVPAGSLFLLGTVPVPADGRRTVPIELTELSPGLLPGTVGTLTIREAPGSPPPAGPATTPPTRPAAGPAPGAVTGTALCGGVDVTLLDLTRAGASVRVTGLARQAFAGRRVALLEGGREVARAVVGADGSFGLTARAPAAGRLATTRYTARIDGGPSSRALKLERRLVLTERRAVGARVRISGRLTGRRPPRTVSLRRQRTCTSTTTVTIVRVSRSGRFSVVLDGPDAGEAYALYRVIATLGRSKSFTVPIAVGR